MLPDFRVRQRDYLLELSRALTQELDLDKLLERVLKISVEMLAGKAGLIVLRSEAQEVQRGGALWNIKVTHGLPPAFLRFFESLLAEVPVEAADGTETIEVSIINHLLRELTRMASLGLLIGVGLPLVARKKVVGVILEGNC